MYCSLVGAAVWRWSKATRKTCTLLSLYSIQFSNCMASYSKCKTGNEIHKMNKFSLLHAAHSRHVWMFFSYTVGIYRFYTDICPILTQITRFVILTSEIILLALNVDKDIVYFKCFFFFTKVLVCAAISCVCYATVNCLHSFCHMFTLKTFSFVAV